jgi:hypothetical protein
MSAVISVDQDTGLEIVALREDADFAARDFLRRDAARQLSALQRLSHAFVERPDTIEQELVDVAIDLCDADSAGISMEKPDGTDDDFYHWVAVGGAFSSFYDVSLPRYPSVCGVALESGEPQHFRVTKRFFDILGFEAPEVLDGLLFPWRDGNTRGTIFVLSHSRTEAFDSEDCFLMQTLADFATLAMRNRRQQNALVEQASLTAATAMADRLARKINNPLQSLANLVYLAGAGTLFSDAKDLSEAIRPDVERLMVLVKELLAVPNTCYVRDSSTHKTQPKA